jgi:gluconate 5-dehydrogenase
VSLNRDALFSLEGKTAVLTGASGFLGRTMAETLLQNGARVIALGRSERLAHEVEAWRDAYGDARVAGYQVDMYDQAALGDTLDRIAAEEASVDIVVNNAHELGQKTGFNTPAGSLEEADFDQWQRHFLGGVFWPSLTVRKLGGRMKAQGSGSIVNISTMYAVVAPSPKLYEGTSALNPPGYSASKAAMLAFTRYVASFWGEHGVRANAILPGPFSNTGGDSENSVKEDDPLIARLKYRTCLNRIGRPSELAGALLFLASDASSYVTGQALIVDGGWTVT